MAVIDGMGGQPAGELAAELALDRLAAFSVEQISSDSLEACITAINQALTEAEEKNPACYGMGCTITIALAHEQTVFWAHVGDCRLYLLRDGKLQQITTDHNMAQFLYEEGELTLDELASSPLRNLLDQACGSSFMSADTGAFTIAPGDLLLLSTDGLHGAVSHDDITAILFGDTSNESSAQALIAAALKAGGRDNITVLVVR